MRGEPNKLAVHLLNLSAPSSALLAIRAVYTLVSQTHHWEDKKKLSDSTRIGFEPKRAEPNGLAVHRLNHSTTSSALQAIRAAYTLVSKTYHWENKNKVTRLDEDGNSNPRGQGPMN
ncbi:hypothetical protein MRX96_015310 [Rhipicephalus microplus]